MQCISIHALIESFCAMEIPTQTSFLNATVTLWVSQSCFTENKKNPVACVKLSGPFRINF